LCTKKELFNSEIKISTAAIERYEYVYVAKYIFSFLCLWIGYIICLFACQFI